MSEAANAIDQRLKTRVAVTAGPHDVGVTFLLRNRAASDEPLQLHERNHDLQDMNGLPLIDYVSLTGPFNVTGPGTTPSRRRIFTCRPATRSRRRRLRAHHLSGPGAARLPPSGHRRRPRADSGAVRGGPRRGRPSSAASSTACG